MAYGRKPDSMTNTDSNLNSTPVSKELSEQTKISIATVELVARPIIINLAIRLLNVLLPELEVSKAAIAKVQSIMDDENLTVKALVLAMEKQLAEPEEK